jgi:DUF4097 and DUF4098 domain-containing protein YvlB
MVTSARDRRHHGPMVERVRITVNSGTVRVIGEPRAGITVTGAQTSDADGETLVRGSSDRVVVHVPAGTDLRVGSASGDVTITGLLGAVSVTTSSADVEAEDVASIDARTNSGKLTVTESRGSVRLRTKSSRARVGRADGDVHIATVSGKVEVGDARDSVEIKTVSGNISVFAHGRGTIGVETVSGKIKVLVPSDAQPDVRLRSMSGKQKIECATGDEFVVAGRSVSGNITVTTE